MSTFKKLSSNQYGRRFLVCAFFLSLVGTETAFATEETSMPVSSPDADTAVVDQDLSAFDLEEGKTLLQEAAEFATGLSNIESVDGSSDLPDELAATEAKVDSKDSAELAAVLDGKYDLNSLDNPQLVGTMSENIPRP